MSNYSGGIVKFIESVSINFGGIVGVRRGYTQGMQSYSLNILPIPLKSKMGE